MINSGSAANATALPLMLVALRVLIKEHTRMQQALVCEFSDPRLPCSLVEATLQLISSHHLSGRASLSSKAALRVSARRLVAERKKIRYRWLSLG